jgi:7,8-dihydropterin-6-yl-methyl-4-(beta-D-ribofuranosyl)aminobenzene 5'-phosphate synthase
LAVKAVYEATGGQFIINDGPHTFLQPGVFLTGHIPRPYDEKTYVPVTPMQIMNPSGQLGVDLVPEDQALAINAGTEVVVLTGCAHAGTINTLQHARDIVGGHPRFVLAGGLHLYEMEEGSLNEAGTLKWEARMMRELNVVAMLGSHCTGVEPFFFIRGRLNLDPTQVAVSAVGTALEKDPRFSITLPQALNLPIGTRRSDEW